MTHHGYDELYGGQHVHGVEEHGVEVATGSVVHMSGDQGGQDDDVAFVVAVLFEGVGDQEGAKSVRAEFHASDILATHSLHYIS